MRKFIIALAMVALCALPLSACSTSNQNQSTAAQQNGKLTVVASFYPMADFAQKIGGDRVEVTNLVPAGTEPHEWEPSTNDMKTIASADVLVYNGAGMEHWVDDVAASSGNADLEMVEASKGIDIQTAVDEDGEQGQDPHVWLSPRLAKKELANIRDAFIEADPDGKSVYEQNYEKYAAEFDELDQEYTKVLSGTASKDLITAHQAFGYLCRDYGLNQVPIEGIEADSEPDAKTMREIIDFVKANKVKTIFTEELVSSKTANSIADATGATCDVLNPLEGLSDEELAAGDDYISVMEANLAKIEKALS